MTTNPVILHLTKLQTRRAKLAADRDNLTNVIAEIDEVIAELDESIRLITVQSNVSILDKTHKTAELDGDQQLPPTPQPGVADHHVSSVSILGETHKTAELDGDQQPPPTPQPRKIVAGRYVSSVSLLAQTSMTTEFRDAYRQHFGRDPHPNEKVELD
jgi:hypothetical protein